MALNNGITPIKREIGFTKYIVNPISTVNMVEVTGVEPAASWSQRIWEYRFPLISASFRSGTHPFRHSYLHCFRVLRSCKWDKLWSKRYSLNTVSTVPREFFGVCMVTLTVAKVKAFRKT